MSLLCFWICCNSVIVLSVFYSFFHAINPVSPLWNPRPLTNLILIQFDSFSHHCLLAHYLWQGVEHLACYFTDTSWYSKSFFNLVCSPLRSAHGDLRSMLFFTRLHESYDSEFLIQLCPMQMRLTIWLFWIVFNEQTNIYLYI